MLGCGLDLARPDIWLHIFDHVLDSPLFHTTCDTTTFYNYIEILWYIASETMRRGVERQRTILSLVCGLWGQWAAGWAQRYAFVKRIDTHIVDRYPLTSRATYVSYSDYADQRDGHMWRDIMIPFLTSVPTPRLVTLSLHTKPQHRAFNSLLDSAPSLRHLRTLVLLAGIDWEQPYSLDRLSAAFPLLTTLTLAVQIESLEGALRLHCLQVLRLESFQHPNDWNFRNWELPSLLYLYIDGPEDSSLDIRIMSNLLTKIRCLQFSLTTTLEPVSVDDILPSLQDLYVYNEPYFDLQYRSANSRFSHLYFTCSDGRRKGVRLDEETIRQAMERGLEVTYQHLTWGQMDAVNPSMLETLIRSAHGNWGAGGGGSIKDSEGVSIKSFMERPTSVSQLVPVPDHDPFGLPSMLWVEKS